MKAILDRIVKLHKAQFPKPPKHPLSNDRIFYYRPLFEGSLLITLMLVYLFFMLNPVLSSREIVIIKPNIEIEIMDIPQTLHTVAPKGKPPNPVVPIASDIVEELIEDDIEEVGIEEGLLDIPAPPKPPGNKEADIVPARLLALRPLNVPKELEKQNPSGMINLLLEIDAAGLVVSHRIEANTLSNAELEKLALDAAYKCKFTPAYKDGKPMSSWIMHSYSVKPKVN